LALSRYYENVFVNCPFDPEYQRLFEALVFAVLDCGFVPRCALEIDDASQVRIEKIMDIIVECRFGIHDISRTELDEQSALPRFNMPLELGIFLGAKRYGAGAQRQKLCLVLDRAPFRYQRFCSDIAGQDVRSHAGSPGEIITLIRNWLRNAFRDSGIIFPSGARMVERFGQFQRALPLLCAELGLDRNELIFNDYSTVASEWLKFNSW
jgi:hypothetical protein